MGYKRTHRTTKPIKHPHEERKVWVTLPWIQFSHATNLAIFVGAILLCFSNSIHGDFVFDDNEAIINNKDVTKSDRDVWRLLEHDFWGSNISTNISHKSYRPLTVLTFRWNFAFAGGLNPTGFHVLNLTFHILVCILLYYVLLDFFREFSSPSSASFICTVLFAVHPIHTECVSNIVGRAELLCALFCLLSLSLYIQSCHNDACLPSFVMVIASGLLCAISVLCKEQGITILGVCSAYDVILFNQFYPLHFLTKLPTLLKEQSTRRLIVRHFVLLISGLLILTLRWKVMGSQPPVFQKVDNPHSFVEDTVLRMLNYNYLYALNAWLCMCPYWLCFDWSMGCVPVVTSLIDLRLLAVLVFWAFLACLLKWSLTEPLTSFKRLALMSFAFIIISFLPASNLFFRVGFVIAERVLYMPSIGVCMLVTTALLYLSQISEKGCSISVILLVCLYISRSHQRSADWTSEMRLFDSAEAVCPLNAKVHYNIAKVHADAGNEDYAIEKYRLAITLNPRYDQAMNNLANVLKERGELVEAESLLNKAVTIRSDFAAAWMNLGIVQATLGKPGLAETSYKTAIRHRRLYPDCYYNLGNLFVDAKRYPEALSAWRNATLQKPSHSSAWLNMIILLDNMERYEDLKLVAEEALRHNPRDAQIHYNVANAFGKNNAYEESENHFKHAIALQPDTANFYSNLGVLYHRWGKYTEAEKAYTQALKLKPDDSQTAGYRNTVQKKLENGDR